MPRPPTPRISTRCADRHAALMHQAVVHAGDGVRQDRCRGVRDFGGHLDQVGRRHAHEIRVAAVLFEADPPHGSAALRLAGQAMAAAAAGNVDRNGHAIARAPLRDAVADLAHLAGEFVTDDARQGAQVLAARQQMQVRAAQPAGVHLDQHLAVAGLRHGAVRQFQRAAITGDRHGAHRVGHAAHSFKPVTAIPWMKARCSTKNRTIIGSVPSTAIAIN